MWYLHPLSFCGHSYGIPFPVASGDDFCSDLSISFMFDRYLDPAKVKYNKLSVARSLTQHAINVYRWRVGAKLSC